jgi:hypothetical protein
MPRNNLSVVDTVRTSHPLGALVEGLAAGLRNYIQFRAEREDAEANRAIAERGLDLQERGQTLQDAQATAALASREKLALAEETLRRDLAGNQEDLERELANARRTHEIEMQGIQFGNAETLAKLEGDIRRDVARINQQGRGGGKASDLLQQEDISDLTPDQRLMWTAVIRNMAAKEAQLDLAFQTDLTGAAADLINQQVLRMGTEILAGIRNGQFQDVDQLVTTINDMIDETYKAGVVSAGSSDKKTAPKQPSTVKFPKGPLVVPAGEAIAKGGESVLRGTLGAAGDFIDSVGPPSLDPLARFLRGQRERAAKKKQPLDKFQ